MALTDTSRLGSSVDAPTTAGVSEMHRTEEFAAGGSMAEGIGGLAAVVLAIVGLAGVYPMYLCAAAALVLGVSFFLKGGAAALRFSRALDGFGGGMSTEFVAGAAGLVLGVLSLLNIYSYVLLPVSAIVFGAALILGCGTLTRMSHATAGGFSQWSEFQRDAAQSAVMAAAGAQVFIGVAAVVLGIIGLAHEHVWASMSLVSMLILGCSVLLSGTALTTRMWGAFRR